METKDKVLVVDDEKHILNILSLYLKKEGYEVFKAENGKEALDITYREKPLVIISDSMMPVMDGLEFCSKVKEDKALEDIFFMMLTGKTKTNDKIEGLEQGADDYLTKPFNNRELVARVNSSMRVAKLQRELKEANDRLRELDQLKEELTHMIVHDMKTPISGILLSLDILMDESLSDNLKEEQQNFLENCRNSSQELFNMVLNLLDINKMEKGKMELNYETFAISSLLEELIKELKFMAQAKDMVIEKEISDKNLLVNADRSILKRVLMNLMTNAIKHSMSGEKIVVFCKKEENEFRIGVKDQGEGIPEEYQEIIFDKFATVGEKKAKNFDTGLGLAFCKLAVESHGGSIFVDSEQGKGSTFWFNLPA